MGQDAWEDSTAAAHTDTRGPLAWDPGVTSQNGLNGNERMGNFYGELCGVQKHTPDAR